MEDPRPAQDLQCNGRGDRFDGLMDAGVRMNEDMGRRGALQVACWETIEEFGRVAGQRKVARANSARELAEWGGVCVQEMDGPTARGLTGPYRQLVGPWGAVQSTPLILWCDQCLA